MKECFKCLRTLPLSDFYAHRQMKDKHLNKCKDCARQDAEIRRNKLEQSNPEWKEKERKRHCSKARSERLLFPEKNAARNAVHNAGRLKEYHWHHWSYIQEHHKDVIRLRSEDHRKAHRHMIYDQERMQYRTLDGVLLDSRAAHEEHIKSLGIVIDAAQGKGKDEQ